MFIFDASMAGHDMVINAGRATTCRCNFKALKNQQKAQKKSLPETWLSPENRLKFSNYKIKKFQPWQGEQNNRTTEPQR